MFWWSKNSPHLITISDIVTEVDAGSIVDKVGLFESYLFMNSNMNNVLKYANFVEYVLATSY